MKALIAAILSLTVVFAPSMSRPQSASGMIKFQQRLQNLEKQVQTLQDTIVAHHRLDQSIPGVDEAEMMVRLRKAIENCGCTFK